MQTRGGLEEQVFSAVVLYGLLLSQLFNLWLESEAKPCFSTYLYFSMPAHDECGFTIK